MNATMTATDRTETAKVLTYRKPVKSSWITDIRYRRVVEPVFGQIHTYLAIFTRDEKTGEVGAMLYRDVPSWVAGLVKAGTGRRSPGLAFNRLVKSKGYAYQRVTDVAKVKELKEMMRW